MDSNTAASCGTKNSTSESFHLSISSSKAVRYLASWRGGNRGPCGRPPSKKKGGAVNYTRSVKKSGVSNLSPQLGFRVRVRVRVRLGLRVRVEPYTRGVQESGASNLSPQG